MKLGFICPNVPGHLNPITALARHLQLRNHEVVFLYSSGDFESSHWPSQFHHTGPFQRDGRTGVVTSLDKLTANHLSTLLDEVLNDSTYRYNAGKLQRAIAETNGLSVAADLIEESLGVTKKAGGR